jgi:prevent-host-death family protein
VPSVVNIHEAKTHFSKLISRVASGEKLIIAKAGKPIALLCPFPTETAKAKRRPGFAKGLIPNSDALFDPALDKEIEDLFYPKNEPTDESPDR